MTVIKEAFISQDIVRSDLLPLSFLEKSVYTGSKGGLRFRLEKQTLETEDGVTKKSIRCLYWKGRLSYEHTPKEDIREASFPFTEEGLQEICSFLTKEFKGSGDIL